jgi:hypothetical protein
MSKEQMQDVCKWHADQLAVKQDPRPGKKNNNTFAVGVIEGKDGKRRLVATSNLDVDKASSPDARRHMETHGIEDSTHNQPPPLKRVDKLDSNGKPVRDADGEPVRHTINTDTNEPYDKKTQTEHHAEQRMNNQPLGEGDSLAAQSPSQGCCNGCNEVLSQPDSAGNRPIDKIPPDRQTR